MSFTAALIGLLAVLAQDSLAQQVAKPKAAPAAAAAAAAAVPASNPAGSLHEALAKSTPKFRTLLDVIKLSPANVPKNVVGTIFAPTDAAVDAFLKSMGLTAADLASQPDLADLMTAYHFVPGYQVTGTEASKGPKKAATGDENYIVTLGKGAGGKLAVTDVQGTVAGVVSGPVKLGKVSVYVIDKVLMSGNYFNSTMTALAFNPGWVTTYGYAKSTGVDKVLAAAKDPYTLFVPTNKAWKPVEPELMEASNAAIADALKYHVTPGARQVPRDFKNVASLPTLLPGRNIKVTSNLTATTRDRYKDGLEVPRPEVTLTPELGYPAVITAFNIYAGRNILHAVDAPLQPNMAVKPAAAPAAAPAASKPGAVAAAAAPSKITTESASKPAAAAAGPKKPATAAAAAAAGPKKPAAAGRRLLSSSSNSRGRRLQQLVAARLLELGSLQTSPGGFSASSRTLEAMDAAATGNVPVQYPNRFGSLPEAAAADGCLNCLKWTKP